MKPDDGGLASPLSGPSREGGSARQSEDVQALLRECLVEQQSHMERLDVQLREMAPLLQRRELLVALIQQMRFVLGEPPFIDQWAIDNLRRDGRSRGGPRKLAHVERTSSDEAAASGEAKP